MASPNYLPEIAADLDRLVPLDLGVVANWTDVVRRAERMKGEPRRQRRARFHVNRGSRVRIVVVGERRSRRQPAAKNVIDVVALDGGGTAERRWVVGGQERAAPRASERGPRAGHQAAPDAPTRPLNSSIRSSHAGIISRRPRQ